MVPLGGNWHWRRSERTPSVCRPELLREDNRGPGAEGSAPPKLSPGLYSLMTGVLCLETMTQPRSGPGVGTGCGLSGCTGSVREKTWVCEGLAFFPP